MLERLERWRAMRGGEDGGRGRSLMVCLGFTIRKWNMFYSTVKINLFMFRFPPLIVEPPQQTATTIRLPVPALQLSPGNRRNILWVPFSARCGVHGISIRMFRHHASFLSRRFLSSHTWRLFREVTCISVVELEVRWKLPLRFFYFYSFLFYFSFFKFLEGKHIITQVFHTYKIDVFF
jgi:hypothetical protein